MTGLSLTGMVAGSAPQAATVSLETWLVIMFVGTAWLCWGSVTGVIHYRKGYSFWTGFFTGVMLGPIGLAIVIFDRKNVKGLEERALRSATVKCPRCGHPVEGRATFCARCGGELATTPADEKTPHNDELLSQGIAAAKAGKQDDARRLLRQAVQRDRRSENGWLWLGAVVETDEQRIRCLQNVLAVNPDNIPAQDGLTMLTRRATTIKSLADVAGESTLSVADTTAEPRERRGERMSHNLKHLGAPLSVFIATLAVFNQLSGLEYVLGSKRVPMLTAIFDPEAVSVIGVDLAAHMMLGCALLFLAVFGGSWLGLYVLFSIIDWLRGRE